MYTYEMPLRHCDVYERTEGAGSHVLLTEFDVLLIFECQARTSLFTILVHKYPCPMDF